MEGNVEIGIAKDGAHGTGKPRAVRPIRERHASEMQKRFVAMDDAGSATAMNDPAVPAA